MKYDPWVKKSVAFSQASFHCTHPSLSAILQRTQTYMQEIYGRNHCYRAIFLRAEDSRKAYSCVIYCFRHYCRKSNGEKNVALFDRNLLFCCMLCTVKSLSRKIDIQSTGSLWYNRLYTYPIRIARSYNPALTHRIHGLTFIQL